ncbi:hypothetical protein [Xanthobacter sp. KR7-225]|uniref:hypothetical protein n=1 Tax=Xanthobacter sp. KR7-225 TaxID=3156613 RepID=UPI0032B50144
MRKISLAIAGLALAGSGLAGSALLASGPAWAEQLNAEQARTFVVGRIFSFTCFEGTSGSGRIYADGSVAGTISLGQKPARFVRLPPNTLRVRGEAVCGYVKGMSFEPCFDVVRTGPSSFRGTLAGIETMWCEFVSNSGGSRPQVASRRKKGTAEASAE